MTFLLRKIIKKKKILVNKFIQSLRSGGRLPLATLRITIVGIMVPVPKKKAYILIMKKTTFKNRILYSLHDSFFWIIRIIFTTFKRLAHFQIQLVV